MEQKMYTPRPNGQYYKESMTAKKIYEEAFRVMRTRRKFLRGGCRELWHEYFRRECELRDMAYEIVRIAEWHNSACERSEWVGMRKHSDDYETVFEHPNGKQWHLDAYCGEFPVFKPFGYYVRSQRHIDQIDRLQAQERLQRFYKHFNLPWWESVTILEQYRF